MLSCLCVRNPHRIAELGETIVEAGRYSHGAGGLGLKVASQREFLLRGFVGRPINGIGVVGIVRQWLGEHPEMMAVEDVRLQVGTAMQLVACLDRDLFARRPNSRSTSPRWRVTESSTHL